jgi:hypothetical protein
MLELSTSFTASRYKTKQEQDEMGKMLRRRIALADGRYLIFYTFEERGELPPPAEKTDGAVSKSEEIVKPKEERRV